MSLSPTSLIHPAPCCARITPTRTSAWRCALEWSAEALRGAWRAALQCLRGPERLSDLDPATLRDLGLSHAPASWTPHERSADSWR